MLLGLVIKRKRWHCIEWLMRYTQIIQGHEWEIWIDSVVISPSLERVKFILNRMVQVLINLAENSYSWGVNRDVCKNRDTSIPLDKLIRECTQCYATYLNRWGLNICLLRHHRLLIIHGVFLTHHLLSLLNPLPLPLVLMKVFKFEPRVKDLLCWIFHQLDIRIWWTYPWLFDKALPHLLVNSTGSSFS